MMDCDALLADVLFRSVLSPDAEAHVTACARCSADVPVMRRVAAAFASAPPAEPPPWLTAALLHAAAPLLAANARRLPRAAWGRLAAAIAVAILPLPAILFVGWQVLHAAHGLLSSVLPETVSLYLVATQAAVLALVLAVTYGAVPLLAAHQLRLQHEEGHA